MGAESGCRPAGNNCGAHRTERRFRRGVQLFIRRERGRVSLGIQSDDALCQPSNCGRLASCRVVFRWLGIARVRGRRGGPGKAAQGFDSGTDESEHRRERRSGQQGSAERFQWRIGKDACPRCRAHARRSAGGRRIRGTICARATQWRDDGFAGGYPALEVVGQRSRKSFRRHRPLRGRAGQGQRGCVGTIRADPRRDVFLAGGAERKVGAALDLPSGSRIASGAASARRHEQPACVACVFEMEAGEICGFAARIFQHKAR